MTKEEFLEGLKRALFSTGSQSLIEYNLDYYSSYIDGEIAKGRSMDDVMKELGDPRLIANSIKVAEGYSDVFVGLEGEVIDGNAGDYKENSDFEFNTKGFDKDYEESHKENGAFKIYNMTGKSLILPLIIALAVLILVVVVIVAVFSFLAPVLLPIIAVLIVVGLIKGIVDNKNRY
nr:DUF1700 domain-containing protein [uncultured Lachnoanaerobaculum sp.]